MPVTYTATSGTGSAAGIWTAIVEVDSVDLSASLLGEIRIDAEEGGARIAEFTLRPADGAPFVIADWVGSAVTIDIADMATGTPASIRRLFTGIVDTPELALNQRLLALRCTDNLQGVVEAMSAAAIDAAIPGGHHSPVIFDPAARGWSRAQDRLATNAAAFDLDPAGNPRLTDWAPKVTPDLLFTDDHIMDGSVGVSFASRHQLTNRVDIDFGYRFPRVKSEGHEVSFDYVDAGSISAHVVAGNWFLQRAAVEAAIAAAGGAAITMVYEPLPNTPAIGSWAQGPYDAELCMGFDALVSFDYGQDQEEAHAITVSNAASIAAVGAMADRLSGALVGEYPSITAAESAMLLYANDLSGIPPLDTAPVIAGYTNSADVTLTADTDRAAADLAMETLIDVAKLRIWGSHRGNAVSGEVALNPDLDLDKTVEIDVPRVNARGKVRSVSHRLNPDSGSATSAFTLAICSIAGTGTSHPETPTAAPAGTSPASTVLATPPGVVFNHGPADDHKITITFPGVEAVERDLAATPIASAYDATITEDLFDLTL